MTDEPTPSVRALFNTVRAIQAALVEQERIADAAQRAADQECDKLKALKTQLGSAFVDLNRASEHSRAFAVDGTVYLRVEGNGWREQLQELAIFEIPADSEVAPSEPTP